MEFSLVKLVTTVFSAQGRSLSTVRNSKHNVQETCSKKVYHRTHNISPQPVRTIAFFLTKIVFQNMPFYTAVLQVISFLLVFLPEIRVDILIFS
jgi:hypothetical protein